MKETYLEAVETIKAAILKSQSRTVRNTNREVLFLYYSIGGYVSGNSREGTWGTGAIDEISARLREELPGLRGFSGRNIKSMRQFYEAWRPYLQVSQPLEPRGKPAAAAADLVLEAEAGPGNRPPLAADLVLEAEAGPGNRPPLAADLVLEAEAGPGNRPPLAAGLALEAEAGPGNRPPLAADLALEAEAGPGNRPPLAADFRGVATYRTADELPEDYRVLTPIMEEAPRLLDHVSSEGGGGAE